MSNYKNADADSSLATISRGSGWWGCIR